MPFKHPVLICPVCGDKFQPIREGKRFCSRKCQQRFNNQKDKPKKAEKQYQLKRLLVNIYNLKRLAAMPEFKDGVSRDNLLSGGVDLSVPPTALRKAPDMEIRMPCYGEYCLQLQDENIPTYKIIHYKS